ncbi:MAG: hypothetical protein IJQ50_03345, partial [Clostridia bacterium]|nr:hypothetical protein [Clostridia bacterium]
AHGHLLGVKKSPDVLAYRAKSFGCNIALFGHTHIFEDKTINGVRCLNPSNKGYFIITDNYIHFDKF